MWLSILSLLLILIGGTCSTANNTIRNKKEAFAYLKKYGYDPCSNSSKNVRCSVDDSSMFRNFQQRHGLKMTGALDAATKGEMSLPRCGNPDTRSLGHAKWSHSSLTWSLRSYPRQISKARASAIISEAFKTWSTHTSLQFTETCSTCKADFVIETGRYSHNCNGGSFDGPSGTLAHAFFPTDGKIHFDADEPWTEAFDGSGINFYLVTVHEIGHALGIEHNSNRKSIMFPSYNLFPRSSMLPDYDRQSIQTIYGVSKGGGGTESWRNIKTDGYMEDPGCPHIGTFMSKTVSQCKTQCEETTNCNGFNYRRSDQACWLKHCSVQQPKTFDAADGESWMKNLHSDGGVIFGVTYQLVHAASDKVLDIHDGATHNEANVELFKNHKGENQLWVIHQNEDGTVKLSNPKSEKVLDVYGGHTSDGTNVQIFLDNGTNAQKWHIKHVGDGIYKVTHASSGKVLDVKGGITADGTNIQIWWDNGTAAQRWRLVRYQNS